MFCGSSSGWRPAYRQAAVDLAEALVARDIRLVFGGNGMGLMGVLADESSGRVGPPLA